MDERPGDWVTRRRRIRVFAIPGLLALSAGLLAPQPARADVGGSIYLVDPDGSGLSLVTDTVVAEALDWSPDGTRLVFENYVAGNADIFVVNTDGSALRRLTDDVGDELRPRWVGDGAVTFEKRGDGGDTEVYEVRDDGSGRRLLLNLRGRNHDWSPDRSRLAFSSVPGTSDIYTMEADGSGLRRLTDKSGDEDHPVWSPDGTRIAFDRSDHVGTDIYVMDAAGSKETQLTFTGAFNGLPDWSPDGTRIAFYSTGWDGDTAIYVAPVDSPYPVKVTADRSTAEGGPVWSPDGTRIAFVRN
jgi:Tol biopolymer transport system component